MCTAPAVLCPLAQQRRTVSHCALCALSFLVNFDCPAAAAAAAFGALLRSVRAWLSSFCFADTDFDLEPTDIIKWHARAKSPISIITGEEEGKKKEGKNLVSVGSQTPRGQAWGGATCLQTDSFQCPTRLEHRTCGLTRPTLTKECMRYVAIR